MPQSFAQLNVHIVFSTKDRRPFLSNDGNRLRVHAYLATIARQAGCLTASVGGVEDHVHLLIGLTRTSSVADLVRTLKKDSSVFAKTLGPALKTFAWQTGYGAFAVSHSHVPAVRGYIDGQIDHHAKVTFKDEFRRLCRKNGVDLDEEHAWL